MTLRKATTVPFSLFALGILSLSFGRSVHAQSESETASPMEPPTTVAETSTPAAETPRTESLTAERPGKVQPAEGVSGRSTGSATTRADETGAPEVELSPHGYVETALQWNFNEPSNGISAQRGFDNRHATLTLSNIALGFDFDWSRVYGRIVLQVGHTPSSYYAAETSAPSGGGANASDANLWKYAQQAFVGLRADVFQGLDVSAGLYLSPIGPETVAIHESWNWSRSNLFFALPYYHTGVRGTLRLSEDFAVTLHGYNGWNTVLDNNRDKSLAVQAVYETDDLNVSVLYFGGVERAQGAPEGSPVRHLFDAYVLWNAMPKLSLMLHGNVGFEPNNFGTTSWFAAAAYARVGFFDWLSVAARGDFFHESVAQNASGRATAIFFPSSLVSSGTLTFDIHPEAHFSIRLEYRHDHSDGSIYFGGNVLGDGTTMPYVADRNSQDTATLGLTAWF